MGETRETRIQEYHAYNSVPVLGLREEKLAGCKGETITLKGDLTAEPQTNHLKKSESGIDLHIFLNSLQKSQKRNVSAL
jgi:dipeptidase E